LQELTQLSDLLDVLFASINGTGRSFTHGFPNVARWLFVRFQIQIEKELSGLLLSEQKEVLEVVAEELQMLL
jgi:hypothetical protein